MLNGNKISNVTIPCLIAGLCKMLVVIVIMIRLNYKDKTNEVFK